MSFGVFDGEAYAQEGHFGQLHDEFKEGVASKDVVIDPQTCIFIRLYLPLLDGKGKVMVLLYVHGGGFCIESAASPFYHSYLNKVATEAKVICASVEYRRAPEHHLPVAYDNCFGVLEWLDFQAMALEGVAVDSWLTSHADFSNVFLAGDSAEANTEKFSREINVSLREYNTDWVFKQRVMLKVATTPRMIPETNIGGEIKVSPREYNTDWIVNIYV